MAINLILLAEVIATKLSWTKMLNLLSFIAQLPVTQHSGVVEVNLILRKTSGSERGHKSPWDFLIFNVQNGRTPWFNIRQYERVKTIFQNKPEKNR